MNIDDLLLCPRPKKIELHPGAASVPDVITVAGFDPARLDALFGPAACAADPENALVRCRTGVPVEGGPEAYALRICTTGIEVESPSPAGVLNGLRTLKQLLRRFGQSLPYLAIEDAPYFPFRGVMLDISRDRVPTMASLHMLIDRLSDLKINHLQLYIEHAFAYTGHEVVWRNASPVTPEEMRSLDDYCRLRGVELCANQNTLGHMDRWLKHPQYAPLGEVSGQYINPSTKLFGQYWQPNTLNPFDPRALGLIRDLLTQQTAAVSGRFVNIGCDEPIDLGYGHSKAQCEQQGRLRIYGEHIARVARIALDLERVPQFWVDSELSNQCDQLPEFPRELTGLVWGYSIQTDFNTRVRNMIERGHEAWVAPGTNSWCSYTGRTAIRRGNFELAAAARKLGATGFLITEWGDLGHRQQWPITLLGMAEGACTSWTGTTPQTAGAAGLHLFGDSAMGEWLAELGMADDHIRAPNANGSFHDTLISFYNPNGYGSIEDWRRAEDNLKTLAKTAPAGNSLPARECRHALDSAMWAVERALLRRSPQPAKEARAILDKHLLSVVETHKELWLSRSRPGGLQDSIDRYTILLKLV